MRTESGYTIASLLISAGSALVLGLKVASLFALVSHKHNQTVDALEAEIVAARAERIFRSYFGDALNFDFNAFNPGAESFNLATLPANTGAGWLRSGIGGLADGVNYTSIADFGGANWHTLALFWREDSTAQGAQGYGGLPRKTAIWFRRPTIATSGMIVIDGGTDPNGAFSGNPMTPDDDDTFIDRVSGLRMVKIRGNPALNKTTAIDITIRIRYHLNHGNEFNWCPVADIPPAGGLCVNAIQNAAVRDIERSFRVYLQNALLTAGGFNENAASDREERTMGSLYFFKQVTPQRF